MVKINLLILTCLALNVFAIEWTGGYNTPGLSNDVEIAGNYAYVADGFSRIPVVDVAVLNLCNKNSH